MIYTDLLITNGYQFPEDDDAWWSNYIRENMHSDVSTRDCSQDMWETAYKVHAIDEVPGKGGPGFKVISAGPDKKFETSDDIVSIFSDQ